MFLGKLKWHFTTKCTKDISYFRCLLQRHKQDEVFDFISTNFGKVQEASYIVAELIVKAK
jgi:hypothetical protein